MKKLIMISLICAAVFTVSAKANVLIDPGFEANPLTTHTNVLTNFAGYQGQWGVENSTIVGAENSITPMQGVKMLRMDDDGLTWTQAFQSTYIGAYAATIDAGLTSVNASAMFNAHPKLSAALCNINVKFFSTANWGSQIGTPVISSLTLDASNITWQNNMAIGSVPVGTRWIMTEIAYQDASLLGQDGSPYPGYVDGARVDIIPEPATICLLGLGGLAMRYKKSSI